MKMPRMRVDRPVPEGVFAPVITPRRDGETEVDLGGMLDVIDFITSNGAQGVALFAAPGEFPHFTQEERGRFLRLAIKRSRVPVLVNVTHSTMDGTIAMAEEAAGSGVAGVTIMPPYFYRYDAETLQAFFLEIGEQVAKWIPIYIDNVPACTSPIPIGVASELLRSGLFAGFKDSSGDWNYTEYLLELSREAPLQILCGDDRLLTQAMQGGAHASVSDIAGAVPELPVSLTLALARGDRESAGRLQLRIDEFAVWMNHFPSPMAVREAAAARGVKTGGAAAPLGQNGRAMMERFRAWFREWIHMVLAECNPRP